MASTEISNGREKVAAVDAYLAPSSAGRLEGQPGYKTPRGYCCG
jgi:hypothetical protein